MTSNPKTRLLTEETLARQFLDMTNSKAFERATELALIQLQEELTTSEVDSGHAFERIRGASRFLQILKTIAEPIQPLPKRSAHLLNHELK